ncbi:MAG: GYD domain-containing protein [Candidatus Deferrimicrobium sp.]
MSTYVVLIRLTDQGIRNVKETTKRAERFHEMAEKSGVKVREILWTMGRFDLVLVIDALDDETMSRLALGLGMLGNAKTETLKAFSAQEMDQIIMGLP